MSNSGEGPRLPKNAGQALMVTVSIFYGGMLVLALFLASVFDLPSIWHLPLEGEEPELSENVGIILGIALGLGVHFISEHLRRQYGWTQGFHNEIKKMIGSPSHGQVALMSAFSAIGEEALFRGTLLPLLGLFPQAIIFGLLHMGPGKGFRFWPFYAAAMGLTLGLLYQATGSLLPAILAHFTINYFGFAALRCK